MLDISLPHKPVVMLRPDLSDLPGWTLPWPGLKPGYSS